jgi:hypothetical protein
MDDDWDEGLDNDLSESLREWLRELEEDVIQAEFAYEPGEFTVYWTHWKPLYDEGLTPRQAWQRALDGFAHARREEEAARQENYARIVAEDQAAIARERAKRSVIG